MVRLRIRRTRLRPLLRLLHLPYSSRYARRPASHNGRGNRLFHRRPLDRTAVGDATEGDGGYDGSVERHANDWGISRYVHLRLAGEFRDEREAGADQSGLAVFTAILNTGIRTRFEGIPGYGTDFVLPQSVEGYAQLHNLPEGPVKDAVLTAFADSLRVSLKLSWSIVHQSSYLSDMLDRGCSHDVRRAAYHASD